MGLETKTQKLLTFGLRKSGRACKKPREIHFVYFRLFLGRGPLVCMYRWAVALTTNTLTASMNDVHIVQFGFGRAAVKLHSLTEVEY